MRPDTAGADTAPDRSPQSAEPEYETAKGCLLLGGAALILLIVIAVAIVFFSDFSA